MGLVRRLVLLTLGAGLCACGPVYVIGGPTATPEAAPTAVARPRPTATPRLTPTPHVLEPTAPATRRPLPTFPPTATPGIAPTIARPDTSWRQDMMLVARTGWFDVSGVGVADFHIIERRDRYALIHVIAEGRIFELTLDQPLAPNEGWRVVRIRELPVSRPAATPTPGVAPGGA